MKKAMTLGFVLALTLCATAQSDINVGPTALPSKKAASSTINVPPVANPGPVAVPHTKPNTQ